MKKILTIGIITLIFGLGMAQPSNSQESHNLIDIENAIKNENEISNIDKLHVASSIVEDYWKPKNHNKAVVRLNLNAQLFDVYEIIDFGQCAQGLTAADFDGDGDMDFAVSSATSPFTRSAISLFYNNGDLNFTQDDVYIFSDSYIETLDSGDYDNDGDIDLIFSYSISVYYQGSWVKVYGVITMLFNDGENHFGNRTMIAQRGSGIPYDPEGRINPKVTSADYDNDGDIDLLVGDNSGKIEFYLNNGTGNFTSAGIIHDWGRCSWGLTSADYDNDGDVDFLVAAALNSTHEVGHIYLKRNQLIESNSSACFEPGPGEIITNINNYVGTISLTSLDYDRNGETDFITGRFWDVFLYINKQGLYDFYQICRLPCAPEGYLEDLTFGALTSADFNNDGYDDFVAGGLQGVVRLFIHNHGLAAITRPRPSRMYIFDKDERESPLLPPGSSDIIIIGRITIDVKGITELRKVEFYVGDILRKIDTTYPYNWTWRVGGSLLQKRTIRIVAYDTSSNSSVAELKVWKLF
jgi:hypothetical protein